VKLEINSYSQKQAYGV